MSKRNLAREESRVELLARRREEDAKLALWQKQDDRKIEVGLLSETEGG